jgi:hypothetical protein
MKAKDFGVIILASLLIGIVFGSTTVFAPAPTTPNPPVLWNAFVTNTSDDPVPVDITDDSIDVTLDEPIEVITTPDFEPYQGWFGTTMSSGVLVSEGGVGWIQEKIFVIEYVSAVADNLDVSDSLSIDITTELNGIQVPHHLGLVEPMGRSKQFLSKEVKIYHEADKMLKFHIERLTGLNEVEVYVRLSGYFMDVS